VRGAKPQQEDKRGDTAMKKTLIILSFFSLIILMPLVSAQNYEDIYSISLPYSATHTVEEEHSDAYRFTAPYSGRIHVELTPLNSNDDPDLYVFDTTTGSSVASSYAGTGQTDEATFSAVAGHSYEVRVYGFDSRDGDMYISYRITIRYTSTVSTPTPTPTPTPAPSTNDPYEPNSAMSQARSISVPTTINNLYLSSTDQDWFRFTLGSRSTVTIETFYPGSGRSVDTIVYLYRSDGSEIAHDDDGGSGLYSRLQITLNPGTYYIMVRSFGHDTGNYGLRVSVSAVTTTPPPATPTVATATPVATTTAPPAVAPPEEWGNWIWDTINNVIITPITNGIRTIAETVMSGINQIAQLVFQPIINGLTYVGRGISDLFSAIYNAILSAVRSVLFGGITTAIVLKASVIPSAQVQLSPLGYVFVGTVLCVVGVVLIVYTSEIPIVNIITTLIGFTLILLGVEVGLFGIAPDYAFRIATIVFTIIWIVGVAVIIYYEVTALRRR